jgi:hypothetical protein
VESARLIRTGKSTFTLPHKRGRCRVQEIEVPESVVGYEEQFVRRLYKQHGLMVNEPVRYGNWCGRKESFDPHLDHLTQDIVVATKT